MHENSSRQGSSRGHSMSFSKKLNRANHVHKKHSNRTKAYFMIKKGEELDSMLQTGAQK